MTALSHSLLDGGKVGLIRIGSDLKIESCSGKLVDWLSTGDVATEVIPFLTGLEGILESILKGKTPSFSLPRVGWSHAGRNEEVLSLEIIPGDAPGTLQLVLRDETELAVLERNILQQRNELALASQALAAAKEKAESLLMEKTTFLASISHDLKTPLQVIIGNAEILRGDVPEEERDVFLQDIVENGDFLLAMITDLLEASALDAGQLILTEEPVDVRPMLEQVVSIARRMPHGTERKIKLSMDESEQTILVDSMRLKRLLVNLVGNAVKFTEDGGQIALHAHRTDAGSFLIEVEDDGCGISPKLIDRVFDPFVMGETSDGSGLGLHIAKGLADLHGAKLSIASEPGQGTRVGLQLPKSRFVDPTT
jgi:signal transduction histidine kinase